MAFLQPGRGRPGPLGERSVPQVVFWAIGAMVAAHLVRVFLPAETATRLLDQYVFVPSRVAAHPLAELSTFLTHMFLQFDVTELAIACLAVLAFGTPVAARFGWAMFLGLFLASGAISAAFELALSPHSALGLGGAFGAVSGVIAAAVRIALGQRRDTTLVPAPLAPLLSVPVAVFSILWIGLAFIFPRDAWFDGKVVTAIQWPPVVGALAAGFALSSLFELFVPKIDLGDDFGA